MIVPLMVSPGQEQSVTTDALPASYTHVLPATLKGKTFSASTVNGLVRLYASSMLWLKHHSWMTSGLQEWSQHWISRGQRAGSRGLHTMPTESKLFHHRCNDMSCDGHHKESSELSESQTITCCGHGPAPICYIQADTVDLASHSWQGPVCDHVWWSLHWDGHFEGRSHIILPYFVIDVNNSISFLMCTWKNFLFMLFWKWLNNMTLIGLLTNTCTIIIYIICSDLYIAIVVSFSCLFLPHSLTAAGGLATRQWLDKASGAGWHDEFWRSWILHQSFQGHQNLTCPLSDHCCSVYTTALGM